MSPELNEALVKLAEMAWYFLLLVSVAYFFRSIRD